MKFYRIILSVLVIIVVLSSCTLLPDIDSTTVCPNTSKDTFTIESKNDSIEAAGFSFNGDAIAEGKLVYSFSNYQMISHINGIPDVSKINVSDILIPFENNTTYQYPEFILDDGSFVDGIYLILIEVLVKNNGARQYTKNDRNEFGDSRGIYDDPYIFEPYIFLVDPSRPLGENYFYSNIHYYSMLGEYDEHRLAFRLEPNQEIGFTIGFFVSDKSNYGGWYDLGKLCLCPDSGSKDSEFVQLNLLRAEED